MSDIEKYNDAFKETFGIDDSKLVGLKYGGVPEWDSVGHMSLVASVEDAFDIMLEPDDIVNLTSYKKGKEILAKYDVKF